MRQIGYIQTVQVQRESLKVGEGSARVYDPTPLQEVKSLHITPDGIHGVNVDGAILQDVHHRDHPRSRNRGDNFVSIGFTGHYTRIRERFGTHLANGIAGENIIVACEETLTPEHMGKAVFIKTHVGELIRLEEILPIPPCEPFCRFAAGRKLSAPEMKEALQFLSNGTRGFYMRTSDDGGHIQVGDTVWIED